MVNGKPGNPKARVISPPLTGRQMLVLVQGGHSKTVRRGRPAWKPPDLAQVEAAAQTGQNMEEIATSLGIDPATFYRKKRNSPEFNEAILIGRENHALATRGWDGRYTEPERLSDNE